MEPIVIDAFVMYLVARLICWLGEFILIGMGVKNE